MLSIPSVESHQQLLVLPEIGTIAGYHEITSELVPVIEFDEDLLAALTGGKEEEKGDEREDIVLFLLQDVGVDEAIIKREDLIKKLITLLGSFIPPHNSLEPIDAESTVIQILILNNIVSFDLNPPPGQAVFCFIFLSHPTHRMILAINISGDSLLMTYIDNSNQLVTKIMKKEQWQTFIQGLKLFDMNVTTVSVILNYLPPALMAQMGIKPPLGSQ
ncbi:hypothetical protein E1189_02060 [Sansalvadorimonas verongulae]|nr:hypothetical protein [Sansalvadorimonas verongulae]